MRNHRLVSVLAANLILIAAARVVAAQEAPVVPRAVLEKTWSEVQKAHPAPLATAAPEVRQAEYEAMFRDLLSRPEIASLRDSASYQSALERLASEIGDARLAQSVNSPLTNPAAGAVVERAGFTNLLALAGDLQQLFSSNDSAISLNLNALALIAGGKEGAYSAPYRYRQHDTLRRLGGTVTFGAKIPEGEITGFTGLPDADKLLDVFVWDVKYRLVGDRDPRARRWYRLLLGEMGDAAELAARLPTLPGVPLADAAILARAADTVLGARLSEARREIASSLQISAKFSGQHLTKEAGRNKYVAAAMLDKGWGGVDLTMNAAYNVVDQIETGATDPFRIKEWQIAAGLTGNVLRDVIASGRSAELSASLTAKLPVDDDAVPIERKDVWKATLAVVLPFQKSAKIPISVTYSNDPNNLKKEKFVTGRIGVSYDFGSVFRALGGTAPKTP
jgi:hypothetical protein